MTPLAPPLTADQGRFFGDLQQFDALRRRAQENPNAAAGETAKQLEALFIQQMLKAMRATIPASEGPLSGGQVGFYREMLDNQLATVMAQGRGLGLAQMLERQLGGDGVPPTNAPAASGVDRLGERLLSAIAALNQRRALLAATASAASTPAPATVPAPAHAEASALPASPEEFIAQLKPYAEAAASALGVSPRILLAQAALESAWGQRMPRHSDGTHSYNLFGIKAHGWPGEVVNSATVEVEQGVAVRRRAGFRSYDSFAHSFSDYVDFLRANPRYRHALAAQDDASFIHGLAKAGYATDPDYAQKVLQIAAGSAFKSAQI